MSCVAEAAVFKARRVRAKRRRVGAARFFRAAPAPEIAARRGGYFAARQKISRRKLEHASAGKHPAEGKRASLDEIERDARARKRERGIVPPLEIPYGPLTSETR